MTCDARTKIAFAAKARAAILFFGAFHHSVDFSKGMPMKTKLFSTVLAAAAASLTLLPSIGTAAPVTKTVEINIYQLCNDAALTVCASSGPAGNSYFADSTNKIWAQAGISVTFNFVSKIFSSAFYDINDGVAGDGFNDLHAAYGTHGPSATIVDMFLVNTVAGAYGEGWLGFGGMVMGMSDIMAYNGGLGRIDTFAHELGHNLGLEPDSLGGSQGHSLDPFALMASGGIRHVPTTLADINPDGLGYDQLNAGEIALARTSSLLRDVRNEVPEPTSLALGAMGLLLLSASRRRGTVNQR